jgi:hypothetical protein
MTIHGKQFPVDDYRAVLKNYQPGIKTIASFKHNAG